MMYIDMPTRTDIERIAAARDEVCVSVYLPTNPAAHSTEHDLLRARALFDRALEQVRGIADKDVVQAIEEHIEGLLEHAEFWFDLGRSLAVFVTQDRLIEFRLPHELEEHVVVSDRFSITPLLRATTFPQSAFVLAISQNENRLVEVMADAPPRRVEVAGVPQDAASAVGLRSISGRSAYGRLQGDEGRKVRLTQYARAVDHALRPILNGESLPLIVAATQPLLAIFKGVSGYAHLAADELRGNADELTDAQLAEGAREILDGIYEAELKDLHGTFLERRQEGRASTDLSDLARAAAFGALSVLAVDMGAEVAGSVSEDGSLELGGDHDAIEEIARLALASGTRVLSVRGSDMPGEVQVAGILRYAV